MKRILPAFLAFVLFIGLIARILLLQKDFIAFVESVEYALKFQANLLFAKSSDYFDVLANEKPLLHSWSLSVEEQFYFIFPILLFFVVRYFPYYTVFFILLAILLSLSTYFWHTIDSMGLDTYFLFRTRVYELLIGALFSCFSLRQFKHNSYAWIFLLPIIIILFFPKDFLLGDGYIERLIVCTCTGFLMLFKPAPLDEREYYLLSTKPLVLIGLISYSLYLWHWGILALMRYVYMEYTLPVSYILIALFLMFFCAYLSYRYIELPLKKLKYLAILGFLVWCWLISVCLCQYHIIINL